MEVDIKKICFKSTLELRQRVLWPDKPKAFCQVDGDEEAIHYGAYLNDVLIGVASVYENSGSARLRKFAVETKHQGRGVGSMMFGHIINEVKNSDVSTFWCDSRESATDFYSRFGLCVEGERFFKSDISYFKMTLNLKDDHEH